MTTKLFIGTALILIAVYNVSFALGLRGWRAVVAITAAFAVGWCCGRFL